MRIYSNEYVEGFYYLESQMFSDSERSNEQVFLLNIRRHSIDIKAGGMSIHCNCSSYFYLSNIPMC